MAIVSDKLLEMIGITPTQVEIKTIILRDNSLAGESWRQDEFVFNIEKFPHYYKKIMLTSKVLPKYVNMINTDDDNDAIIRSKDTFIIKTYEPTNLFRYELVKDEVSGKNKVECIAIYELARIEQIE